LGEWTTANGLERAMAKAWHGEIGEAWTGFGHISDEQGNGRGRRWTARYKLWRITTANSGELHCESEGGERRESELGQAEGEGSVGVL
jgi:hypothetical protein